MVEQFGFAMILSSAVNTFAFTSGTTNFFVGSIRQAEELSITVDPTSAKRGAHSKETEPPAEKMATSGLAATASSIDIMVCILPANSICFPTERAEATPKNSVIGKFLSSKTVLITVPTRPVTPTTATFIM